MKLIHKFKSPNYNNRKFNKIEFIIIHYTALISISQSIKHLCLKDKKVSSHYVISQNGEIYNLVSDDKRAWHSGLSYWRGETDVNSKSIGIELDYSSDKTNNKYSKKLMKSLILLIKYLVKKYNIRPENILGHSDVAPYRKKDPGRNFPWHLLEKKKLAYEIKNFKDSVKFKKFVKKWHSNNNFNSNKKKILFMLGYIGYDVSLAFKKKLYYEKLILNYSNRFRYYQDYNYNYERILNVVELHFFSILLTRLKK